MSDKSRKSEVKEEWEFDEAGASHGCPRVVEKVGGYPVADLRGWGHLTGTGALNLPAEQAAKIQDARGRLLAAAPDLLKSLQNLVGLARMRGGSLHEYAAALADADAAIAKAKGRS